MLLTSIFIMVFGDERTKKEAWFSPFKSVTVMKLCFDMRGMLDYFKMGLPSIGMLCLEWWCYEFMMFFACYLPNQGETAA